MRFCVDPLGSVAVAIVTANGDPNKQINTSLLSSVRLVFSQSLISLDLIEDFLELAGRAKEEGNQSIYKGRPWRTSHKHPTVS